MSLQLEEVATAMAAGYMSESKHAIPIFSCSAANDDDRTGCSSWIGLGGPRYPVSSTPDAANATPLFQCRIRQEGPAPPSSAPPFLFLPLLFLSLFTSASCIHPRNSLQSKARQYKYNTTQYNTIQHNTIQYNTI